MKIAAVAICLLLAGCAIQSDRPQVRIANAGTGLQTWCMPITLAERLGYYKEEGLDVVLENLVSTTKALQAVIGGSSDIAICTYAQVLQVASEGQRVRSFFVLTRRDSKVLLVAPAARDRIRRIEDLHGALIGVPAMGSATHQWLKYYLATHALAASNFRTISIGFGASAFAAIESGRVDVAGMTGGDHFHLLRRHPGLHILADTSTAEGMQQSYGSDTFAGGAPAAKQEWLDHYPDSARKIAHALQRTLQWIATHKAEEIRDQLPESFRSEDAAVDLDIIRWSLPSFTVNGEMPSSAPQIMKRMQDATADPTTRSKIDLAATWTNEYLQGAK